MKVTEKEKEEVFNICFVSVKDHKLQSVPQYVIFSEEGIPVARCYDQGISNALCKLLNEHGLAQDDVSLEPGQPVQRRTKNNGKS